MVEKTSSLVPGQEECRVCPKRRLDEGINHTRYLLLAKENVQGRVLTVKRG